MKTRAKKKDEKKKTMTAQKEKKCTGKMDWKKFLEKVDERYEYYNDPKTWVIEESDGTVHPSEHGWGYLPEQDQWEMCFEYVLKHDCNIPDKLVYAIAHQLWHSGKNIEKAYQELVVDRMWEKNKKLKGYIESMQGVDAIVYCKKGDEEEKK